jgi:hypothetical protein
VSGSRVIGLEQQSTEVAEQERGASVRDNLANDLVDQFREARIREGVFRLSRLAYSRLLFYSACPQRRLQRSPSTRRPFSAPPVP